MSLLLHKEHHKKIVGVLVPLFLIIALPVLLLSARQTTEDRQQASPFRDLNKGFTITQTNNSDGTMGPGDWMGNFSNTLTPSQLGTITLLVTDPNQSGSPTGTDSTQGGVQKVTSLVFTITKAEVHLSQLTTNQQTDHWETLRMNTPLPVNLVELAKGSFSLLGLTKLASGMYSEIRIYITNPQAVLQDGTKVTLDLPGRNNTVRITQPFMVSAGVNTNLTVDFDAQNSVLKAGDRYILKPVVSQMIESHGTAPTPTITLGAKH